MSRGARGTGLTGRRPAGTRRPISSPDPGGPNPFSLSDPVAATAALEGAGLADVVFTAVEEPRAENLTECRSSSLLQDDAIEE